MKGSRASCLSPTRSTDGKQLRDSYNLVTAQERREGILHYEMPVRRHHLLQLQKWEALGHGASFPAMHRSTAPAGCPRRTPAELERGSAATPATTPPPAPQPPRTAAGAADHPASEPGARDQQLQKKKKSLERKGTQRKGSKRLLAYTAPPDDLLAAAETLCRSSSSHRSVLVPK